MDQQLYFFSELNQNFVGKKKLNLKMFVSYQNKTRNWSDLTMNRLNLMR